VTLRTPRTAARRGFTLIEVMLASILAAFVLAAVYMLMNVTVTQTMVSRDAVDVEDLSRGLFGKMGADLGGTLAPLPPKSGGNNAASGGGSSSSGTSASGTGSSTPSSGTTPTPASGSGSTGATAAAPTSTDASAAGTAATDPSATDNSTAAAADYAFQGGVIGDEKKLIIFAGRVPEAFGRYGEPGQVRSDQRQIIYWLGKSGAGGLYRRERPWVTADEVRTAADDDETATDSTLLAEEVTDLQFEYSDGTTWASTWDGTTPGPDGVTPLGPPRAVRVTLTLSVPMSRGEPLTKQITQVIAVRSAPGTYPPPLLEAATDGGDNAVSGDPSSSGGSTTGANGTGASSGGATGGAAGASSGATKSTGSTGGSTGGSTPSAGKATGTTGGNSMGGGTGSTGGSRTGGGTTGGTGGSSMGGGTGSTGGSKGGGR
jgi:prepilin-type N-terminal cleavage/methylation domain-containing protein